MSPQKPVVLIVEQITKWSVEQKQTQGTKLYLQRRSLDTCTIYFLQSDASFNDFEVYNFTKDGETLSKTWETLLDL